MTPSAHHSFSVELAQEIGIEAAILVHHLLFWISYNKRLTRNYRDGRTWTFQTMEEIAAHLPYFSKDKINDLLDLLCEGKTRKMKEKKIEPILVSGNYNKSKFDKTLWYAFIDEEKWLPQKSPAKMEISKMGNGQGQNPEWIAPTPIPDTKQDAKQDTTTTERSVVVVSYFSCLDDLDLDEKEKVKLSKKLTEDKAKEMVRRVTSWESREDDLRACYSVLARWDSWNTNPRPTKKQKEAVREKQRQDKQETLSRNRIYASELAKRIWKAAKEKGVIISNMFEKLCIGNDEIYLDNPNFKELTIHALRKQGLH